jgi:hypothetical protein
VAYRAASGQNRSARLQGFGLKAARLIGEPFAQVRRQVVAQRDAVAFAVLFVRGIEGRKRYGVLKV